jgi:hypothetical protein
MNNIAFIRGFGKMREAEMSKMYAQLNQGESPTAFRGLILNKPFVNNVSGAVSDTLYTFWSPVEY